MPGTDAESDVYWRQPDDVGAARSGEAGCRAGRGLATSNVLVLADGVTRPEW